LNHFLCLPRFLFPQILTVAHIFVEHKRRLSPGPDNGHDILPLPKDDWDSKQGVIEDAEQETPVS